jgi:hypothetical protein
MLTISFRIFWAIDAMVTAIAGYFFLAGLTDGSVSAFNLQSWLSILVGLASTLMGSLWLKNRGHIGLALILAAVPAVPSLGFGLILLIAALTGARWN